MIVQLFKQGIVKGLGSGLLYRAVHTLNLAIDAGMKELG